jgi:Flp pilus assembly pilin Flp
MTGVGTAACHDDRSSKLKQVNTPRTGATSIQFGLAAALIALVSILLYQLVGASLTNVLLGAP